MNFIDLFADNPYTLEGACIALLGGGGKTTLLHKLGLEFSFIFKRVLLSSLTQSEQSPGDQVVDYETLSTADFSGMFSSNRQIFVMHSGEKTEKLQGLTETELQRLLRKSDICLFECDGARQLPLKAHLSKDPDVPTLTTHVIILVGADAVDTACCDGLIHRPQEFMRVWDTDESTPITAGLIAKVMTTQKGYLQKIRHKPKLIYFVNKWDRHPEKARLLASTLRRQCSHPVYYGTLKENLFFKAE